MRTTATVALFSLAALASLAVACQAKTTPSTTTTSAAPVADPAAKKAEEGAGLSPKAKLALARVTGASEVDKKIELAQGAARKNPANADLWIVLGRAWVRKARESNDPGFYLNADACADVVLQEDPGSTVALDLKSLVQLNDHRFEDAKKTAERVVASRPDDAMAHGSLSDALLEMGLYEDATAHAQAMIDLKPNLPSYSRASHLQWLHGDVAGAKQTVRLAIDAGRDRKDPEPRAWVLTQAAMIFWHEGDFDGADAGFDVALHWLGEFPPALVGKGRVAMAKGESKRAAEYFQRAHTQSPLVETAWLLGDARAAAGDDKGAAEAYAKVRAEGRRTDPRTLSLFLSARGEDAELALSLADEEYKVRKDILTEDARAWALYRGGKIAEAKRSIERARRLGTPDARLMFHEGAIKIAAGDKAAGRRLVEKALATNAAFDARGVEEAKKLLEAK